MSSNKRLAPCGHHLPIGSALAVAVALAFALAAGTQKPATPPARTLLQTASEQAVRGAELYDKNCAVCHGDTGAGFAEARSVFPEDHQRCERCHHPGNPAEERNMIITPRSAFSLGEPPALHGDGAMAGFADAGALYNYIRARMPRYDPGRLSDRQYLDLTAFLLDINGLLPEGVTVSGASASSLTLPAAR